MKKKIIPVSVIVPCYKSSETIERAINSIMNQTLMPLEVIIVDDFSNDEETYHILAKLKSDNEIIKIILLEENVGPGSARNRGWECARGKYIAFLDSDDIWHPQKLQIQYKFMEQNPHVGLTAHDSKIFEGTMREKSIKNIKVKKFTKFQFLFKNRIPTRTVMLKKDIPMRFAEGKRASEDFLLWSEIYLNNILVRKISLDLAYSFKENFGESGLTASLIKMQRGQIDSLKRLNKKKLISNRLFLFLYFFSYMKYVRRKLIVTRRSLF